MMFNFCIVMWAELIQVDESGARIVLNSSETHSVQVPLFNQSISKVERPKRASCIPMISTIYLYKLPMAFVFIEYARASIVYVNFSSARA